MSAVELALPSPYFLFSTRANDVIFYSGKWTQLDPPSFFNLSFFDE